MAFFMHDLFSKVEITMYNPITTAQDALSKVNNLIPKDILDLSKYRKNSHKFPAMNQNKSMFAYKSKTEIDNLLDLPVAYVNSIEHQSKEIIQDLTAVLVFLRDKHQLLLSPSTYLYYLDQLQNIRKLTVDEQLKAYSKGYAKVALPLCNDISDDKLLEVVNSPAYRRLAMSNEQSLSPNGDSVDDVFKVLVAPYIDHLKYLEKMDTQENDLARLVSYKAENKRISHKVYHYLYLSDDIAINLNTISLSIIKKELCNVDFIEVTGTIESSSSSLSDCSFVNCRINDSYFDGVDFHKTSIERTVFTDTRFSDTDFAGLTNTESAIFINCNICASKVLDCKALFIDCEFIECETANLNIVNRQDA